MYLNNTPESTTKKIPHTKDLEKTESQITTVSVAVDGQEKRKSSK